MSSYDTNSEQIVSRTSSDTFDMTFSGLEEDNEDNQNNSENKLDKLLQWFKDQNIEAGDPLSIQEECLREGKAKIASLLSSQNQSNSFQSKISQRVGRKPLRIQTKF